MHLLGEQRKNNLLKRDKGKTTEKLASEDAGCQGGALYHATGLHGTQVKDRGCSKAE